MFSRFAWPQPSGAGSGQTKAKKKKKNNVVNKKSTATVFTSNYKVMADLPPDVLSVCLEKMCPNKYNEIATGGASPDALLAAMCVGTGQEPNVPLYQRLKVKWEESCKLQHEGLGRPLETHSFEDCVKLIQKKYNVQMLPQPEPTAVPESDSYFIAGPLGQQVIIGMPSNKVYPCGASDCAWQVYQDEKGFYITDGQTQSKYVAQIIKEADGCDGDSSGDESDGKEDFFRDYNYSAFQFMPKF